ncbi:hypothetical protein DFH28DRAFT_950088 [Melampsora americana]|nr:hypothetical protein DFH28DRAFT_950088 [Melampsora americana]
MRLKNQGLRTQNSELSTMTTMTTLTYSMNSFYWSTLHLFINITCFFHLHAHFNPSYHYTCLSTIHISFSSAYTYLICLYSYLQQ